MDAREIYDKYVSRLSQKQRQELLDLMSAPPTTGAATHSLLELEGLGAGIWLGVDAQKYIDDLRGEWDHRL